MGKLVIFHSYVSLPKGKLRHSKPWDCMILHGIVWQHIFRQLPGFRSHCWVLVKGHCNHKGDLMRNSEEVGTYYCKYVQTSGDSHPVQRLFIDFSTHIYTPGFLTSGVWIPPRKSAGHIYVFLEDPLDTRLEIAWVLQQMAGYCQFLVL